MTEGIGHNILQFLYKNSICITASSDEDGLRTKQEVDEVKSRSPALKLEEIEYRYLIKAYSRSEALEIFTSFGRF